MAEPEKYTEDTTFKVGVMSPNSKQTFAGLRKAPKVITKQMLIFDEEIFEQKFLKCLVCRELFDLVSRTPRLLPCHHTFCAECLDMFFKKECEYRQSLSPLGVSGLPYAVSIICPHCSANFITTEEGLRELSMDHRVIHLLDFIVGHTDTQAANFCPKHNSQPLNFFCEQCIQSVCRDCTVLDHKACVNKDLVHDMQGALEKYALLLDNGVLDMEKEAKLIDEKKEILTSQTATVDKGKDTLCKDITDAFERLRTALNERETELLEMAGSQSGKGNDSTEDKLKYLKEKEAEVSVNIDSLKAAKLEGKLEEMVKIQKEISKYKSDPVNVAEQEEDEKTNSTFNGREETLLMNRISNFGDIQTSTSRTERGYSSSNSRSGYVGSTSRYTGSTYTNRYTPKYSINKY